MADTKWHFCGVSTSQDAGVEGVPPCDYKTKNRNAMRVHLRTKHQIYYCEHCRVRWYGAMGQKQMWKRHMEKDCRQHPEIRGKASLVKSSSK